MLNLDVKRRERGKQGERDESGGGGERVAEKHVEEEGERGDEIGRHVPHALREGLYPHVPTVKQ